MLGIPDGMKILQRKRTSLWLLLVDSVFIAFCAMLVIGVCGTLVFRLPFHTDYRHDVVAGVALVVAVLSGSLWFVRHR